MISRSLVLSAALALAGLSSAAGWQRVRVNVPDANTLRRLQDSGLDMMECTPHLGYSDVILAPGEDATLIGLGFQYMVLGSVPSPLRKTAGWDRQSIQVDDYRLHYFNADQILAWYEALRAQYPLYVTRVQIGTTINGEAHWAYRVGRPLQQGPKPFNNIIVQGLIHAREWISGAVTMHLAYKTVEGLTTIQASPFLTNQAVWFVPMTNPDGYRYTWTTDRLWRKNRRNNGGGRFGVDLNRNYSKGWGGADGSSGNAGSDTYRGTAPFSEPETANIRNFAATLPRIGGFLDLHSYSQLILWPWGYTDAAPADAATMNSYGAQIRTAMNAFGRTYTQGQCATTLYIASGVSTDYFYDQYGVVPSFTFELRDTGQFGFELPENQILGTQDEAWAGFKKMLSLIPS